MLSRRSLARRRARSEKGPPLASLHLQPPAPFPAIRAQVVLGICAMDKKAKSKPMNEILKRLPPDVFEIRIFGDACILSQPIEAWPIVDCLIAFYSKV